MSKLKITNTATPVTLADGRVVRVRRVTTMINAKVKHSLDNGRGVSESASQDLQFFRLIQACTEISDETGRQSVPVLGVIASDEFIDSLEENDLISLGQAMSGKVVEELLPNSSTTPGSSTT